MQEKETSTLFRRDGLGSSLFQERKLDIKCNVALGASVGVSLLPTTSPRHSCMSGFKSIFIDNQGTCMTIRNHEHGKMAAWICTC